VGLAVNTCVVWLLVVLFRQRVGEHPSDAEVFQRLASLLCVCSLRFGLVRRERLKIRRDPITLVGQIRHAEPDGEQVERVGGRGANAAVGIVERVEEERDVSVALSGDVGPGRVLDVEPVDAAGGPLDARIRLAERADDLLADVAVLRVREHGLARVKQVVVQPVALARFEVVDRVDDPIRLGGVARGEVVCNRVRIERHSRSLVVRVVGTADQSQSRLDISERRLPFPKLPSESEHVQHALRGP
jgi:hypothetical protein